MFWKPKELSVKKIKERRTPSSLPVLFYKLMTGRLENYVAEIKIKELPDNFRVVSVKAKHVSQLTVDDQTRFKKYKGSYSNGDIICVVISYINVINEKSVGTMHSVHGGSYTELENLQKYVSNEMKWRDAILEELNSRSFEN
jgi:hypothetical protein